MERKISLKAVGIIAGSAAIFAFLFGMIISIGIPGLANRSEASQQVLQPLPLVNEEGESPFTRIAEVVSPVVVNISAERVVQSRGPDNEWYFRGPFEDFFRDFFKDFPKYEGKAQTLGSGFIISEDGYIVTNYHVVKDASDIIVKLTDKKEYKGKQVKVIGTDQRTDIALLKIETKDRFQFLKFGDSDKIKVGDWVMAVGNPFNLEGTVTIGVISAKGRSNLPLPEGPDFQSFLQTDAAINPGNSGGPLVNVHGEVIGINTAITSTTGGNVGIGFAIPANLAKTVIDELRTKGKVTRGYLGIYLADITSDMKEAMALPSLEGVLVDEVVDNTPASKAGLKDGDVIVEFDGKKVTDMQSFRIMVASTPVDKKVQITFIRDGKEKTAFATLGETPAVAAAKGGEEDKTSELGLNVVDLDSPGARQYEPSARQGVVVIGVDPGSPAEEAGIVAGDVILGIGKNSVKDLAAYRAAIAKLEKDKPVIFQIQRGERKKYIALTP